MTKSTKTGTGGGCRDGVWGCTYRIRIHGMMLWMGRELRVALQCSVASAGGRCQTRKGRVSGALGGMNRDGWMDAFSGRPP
jgi:hypothetical protein